MYVACDASQLEWRTAVELSKDPVGIKELQDKTLDIHANNQTELYLPSRLIAKIFLFRTIFRGTGWSFANDPSFSHVSSDPQYWDERNDRFYKKYRGLDQQHHIWASQVVARQPIKSFTGREWFIPMKEFINERTMEMTIKTPWTDLSNYPVQGTGADIMAIARISLSNRLKRSEMNQARLVATVHDSLVTDVPDELVKPVAQMMYEVFDDIPKNIKKLFKYETSVEFPCEVKYGKNLLEMEKLPREQL